MTVVPAQVRSRFLCMDSLVSHLKVSHNEPKAMLIGQQLVPVKSSAATGTVAFPYHKSASPHEFQLRNITKIGPLDGSVIKIQRHSS